MAKSRGYPDRRGMGAQSDFVSETFDPGERHKAEQVSRAGTLLRMGIAPEQVAEMLSLSLEMLKSIQRDAKDSE
jgi:hypothetical protein